jgi:hypothetical protein
MSLEGEQPARIRRRRKAPRCFLWLLIIVLMAVGV